MPALDAKLIFAVLGPVFLLMGLASLMRSGGLQPQAKTWLLVGTIFSLVAAWLWWGVR
jgi:hypothetical protein